MEPTSTPYSSARLAMAAQFKRRPGRAPIDPLRECIAMEPTIPTYQACKQLTADLAVAFRAICLVARRAAAVMVPVAPALEEVQRGPTIGRTRRRRRARGRARDRH